MTVEGENLGVATIYLTVDKSSMDATIGKAKLELAGMGAEASKQYEAASAGQRKLAESLVRQAELIGKTRAEQIAYNAQQKLGGALGNEIAAKALANAQAMTAAQQESVAAAKAATDAQAAMAAAEDARFKQIASDAMAEVEARQAIAAATMEQARANAALAEASGAGAAGGAAQAIGALDSATVQQQIADYAALDAVMSHKVVTTEEVAAAEAALDRLQAAGMISNEDLAESFAALDKATITNTAELEANTAANLENAGSKRINSRTAYTISALITDAASGQLSRSRREMAALANETGVLQKLMSPTGLAIGGVVAALGAFGIAALKGEEETSKFNNALIMTGGYADKTAAQLQDMAKQLDSLPGITEHAAAGALAAVVATGKFSGAAVGEVAKAALELQQATGQAVDKTIAAFEKLGKDPVKGILDLNDSMHFLTQATYDQITALVERGEKDKAAQVAQDAYSQAVMTATSNVNQNLGYLQRGWNAVKSAASEAWDAMEGAGRQNTTQDKINAIQNLIAEQKKAFVDPVTGRTINLGAQGKADRDATIKNLQAQLADLRRQQLAEGGFSHGQSFANKLIGDRIDAQQALLSANPSAQSTLNAKLDDLAERRAKALMGVVDPDKRAAIDAAFNEQVNKAAREYDAALKRLDKPFGRAPKDNTDKLRQMGIDDIQKQIAEAGKEADAQARSAAEVKAFTDNLNAQLQTRKQMLNLQVQAVGMGDKEIAQKQELLQIEQQYERAQAQLDKEHADHSRGMTESQYAEESAALKAHYEADIALTKKHYTDMDAAQASWVNGAIAAMQNWADAGMNVADQVKGLFTDAFSQMDDALVSFVQTGKLSFSKLADSIIADLVRIELRVIDSQILSSLLWNIGGYGAAADSAAGNIIDSIIGNANGGVYSSPSLSQYSNGVYDTPQLFAYAKGGVFAEDGPEAVMPLSRGSDGKLGVKATGGGNTTVIVENHSDSKAQVQQSKDSSGNDLIKIIVGQAVGEVDKRIARGGSTGQMIQQVFGLSRRGIPVS